MCKTVPKTFRTTRCMIYWKTLINIDITSSWILSFSCWLHTCTGFVTLMNIWISVLSLFVLMLEWYRIHTYYQKIRHGNMKGYITTYFAETWQKWSVFYKHHAHGRVIQSQTVKMVREWGVSFDDIRLKALLKLLANRQTKQKKDRSKIHHLISVHINVHFLDCQNFIM